MFWAYSGWSYGLFSPTLNRCLLLALQRLNWASVVMGDCCVATGASVAGGLHTDNPTRIQELFDIVAIITTTLLIGILI